ncbi:MAG: phospholipid/cholesterol/gamma-HCH transport system permease protein [Verrucomicrobia bacterium]|nr:MAG: phospholipid/cholesterol/gamma-HCH transport system permease protein [Verrucomicrobiota bacterium]
MPVSPGPLNARVALTLEGDTLAVALAGTWQVTESRPSWAGLLGAQNPARVRLVVADVEKWDTSLLLFLFEVQQWCRGTGAFCETAALPEKIRTLLGQLSASHATSVPFDRSENFITTVGLATQDVAAKGRAIFQFVGECVLSAQQLVRNPRKFRWRDCLDEMQQCGAMALPIVSLVSLLVGVTLAYIGAVVLRQYGGDIYVADFIGLSMVREMGALMTAMVLSGRTGAAFAATLGNMKANEEIDALETLGIPAVQFLVLPRLIALGVMMPLLALYANALGIIGGVIVAFGLLGIPPAAFWIEMLTIVDLSDILSGVIKATAFGLIVGLSGCLRGLQADRSAAGVGRAATSAVVTAILLIIIADAIFAILFNALGI